MEQGTQVFAAISFLVIGLSHLGQPKVAFHNVWHGPALLLTLVGSAQVLKGAGRFLAPQVGLRMMQRASPERAWYSRLAE